MFVAPILFVDALRKFGQRTPVGSILSSAEWSRVPVALRERALFSARVEDVRFLEYMGELLDAHLKGERETLPNGSTRIRVGSKARFVALAREMAIKLGLGPLDPRDVGTNKDITSLGRLRLIFDVQTSAARLYGQWKQGMDPAVLNEFPASRFVREVDVRKPRRRHVDNEGAVRLKTDYAFWLSMNAAEIGGFGVPWGPWGFNSGMGVEDVDRREAVRLGLLRPNERLTPVDLDFNEGLKASATNLRPESIAWLQSQFGDQITITDGAVHWRWDAPLPRSLPRVQIPPVVPPEPVAVPAPAPVPLPAPVPPTQGRPVSAAVIVPEKSPATWLLALALIDSVHGDGVLAPIPLQRSRSRGSNGTFWSSDSAAVRIDISTAAPHPALTLIHEVGHFLDHSAISVFPGRKPTSWASDARGPLEEVFTAIFASPEYSSLSSLRASPRYLSYLKRRKELFARAYTQFIASRAPDLIQVLLNDRGLKPIHWTPENFAPIDAAIQTVFRRQGWLPPLP